jgi:glyoxylase-like metal-dependent hydrolase (beta-lactamase superfamily II)
VRASRVLGRGMVEFDQVAPGLWAWTQDHPEWQPDAGWEPRVTSWCLEAPDTTVLIDPLLAPDDAPGAGELWQRLDQSVLRGQLPLAVVVVKPDHVRSAADALRRYAEQPSSFVWGSSAVGPRLDPHTPFQSVTAGDRLPGGVLALDDGRGKGELPLWIPSHRALVFADAVIARPNGALRVWWAPGYRERVLPALRALLHLPVERVLVSHGPSVRAGGRAALAQALERPPWRGE